MAEEIGSLYATIGADVSPFQSALAGVAQSLGGLGGIISGLSFGALFSGAVNAAANEQSAVSRLEAALKSTSATTGDAADSTGHWATVVAATGPAADKLRGQIDMLNAKIADHEAALSKAKGSHQTLIVTIDQEQQKLADLHAKLGDAAVGTKEWVDATTGAVTVSHMSEQALIDLATQLGHTTEFSKTATMGAESMLLTFRNIGSDVFPQATQATLDMAQMMGMNASDAALQLGKALNEPSKSLTNLRREGIQFSAQQEAQIKAFEKQGDLASAQKIILDELATEFGGQATAAGQTFNGQMDILNNTFQEVLATIGDDFLPILQPLVGGLTNFLQMINTADPQLLQFAGIVIGLGAALTIIPPIFALLGGVLGAVLTPILAVGAAAAGLYLAWQTNFGGIKDIVQKAYDDIKPIFDNITEAITYIFNPPTSSGPTGGDASQNMQNVAQNKRGGQQFGGDAGDGGGQLAIKVPDMGTRISQEFNNLLPIVTGAIGKLLGDIGNWITGTGIPMLAASIDTLFTIDIPNLVSGRNSWASGALTAVTAGVQTVLNNVGDWVTNTGIPEAGNAIGKLFNIDPGVIKSLTESISGLWDNNIKPALDGLNGSLSGFVSSFSGIDTSGIQNILRGLAVVIGALGVAVLTVGGDALKGIVDALTPLGGVLASIAKAINDLGNLDIGKFFQDLASGVSNLGGAINAFSAPIVNTLIDFVTNVLHTDPSTVETGYTRIKNAMTSAASAVSAAFTDLPVIISNAWQSLERSIISAALSIFKAVQPLLSIMGLGGVGDLDQAGLQVMLDGISANPTPLPSQQNSNFAGQGSGAVGPFQNTPQSIGSSGSGQGSNSAQSVNISGPVNVYGVQDIDSLFAQLKDVAAGNNMQLGTQLGGH